MTPKERSKNVQMTLKERTKNVHSKAKERSKNVHSKINQRLQCKKQNKGAHKNVQGKTKELFKMVVCKGLLL